MAEARKERRAKRWPSSAASIGGPSLPSSAAGNALEDAQDLTQEFFLMILKGDLLQRANADRGRFRALLLTSLQHFLIDSHTKAHARKRGGDVQFVSWDDWMAEAPSHLAIPASAVEGWPAERIFDVRWAATLAEQALRRLQEECESRGRRRVFDVLSTALTADRDDVSYEKLAARAGRWDAPRSRRLLHHLRRRYRQLLRAEVAETIAQPEEVDAELHYLVTALAAGKEEGKREPRIFVNRRSLTRSNVSKLHDVTI